LRTSESHLLDLRPFFLTEASSGILLMISNNMRNDMLGGIIRSIEIRNMLFAWIISHPSRSTGASCHYNHLIKKYLRKPKCQWKMDNPETQATLAIQDTGLRQSRDTSNIGHTRLRTKTIQRHRQHWPYKTQD
jgi:hypothetical protein